MNLTTFNGWQKAAEISALATVTTVHWLIRSGGNVLLCVADGLDLLRKRLRPRPGRRR